MKTYMMKGLITAGMAVVIATGAFAAGDMKAAMEHIRSNQQQVNQDLIKVNRQQQRVKTAGQACRTDKSAAAHKEYKDAKYYYWITPESIYFNIFNRSLLRFDNFLTS